MLPDLSVLLLFGTGGLEEQEQCFLLAVAFLEPDGVGVNEIRGISTLSQSKNLKKFLMINSERCLNIMAIQSLENFFSGPV